MTEDVAGPRPADRIPPAARRAATAGFVGTFIEYFDFALYGTLTVYLAPLFFPAQDPALSLLAGLAVFGAGFVARPIGGILFGYIGDRRGRRLALLMTVLLMGACSGLVGVLPTYAQVGALAPILLVLLRLGQGLSAGSEMLGSVTFVIESAPPNRRVFLASLTPFGSVVGGTVGGVGVAVLAAVLSKEAMGSYGWRIAFLMALPLAVIAFLLRKRIEDSPEFVAMQADHEIVRSPLREAVQVHWRRILIAGGLAIGVNGTAGLAPWFTTYLAGNRGLPVPMVLAVFAATGLIAALFVPVAGRLGDRFGQRRVVTVVLIGYLVAIVPIMLVLSTATDPVTLALGTVAFSLLGNLLIAPAFSYIAQLFPRNVRYTAANLGQNIGTVLGSGVAPFVGGLLLLLTGTAVGAAIWIGLVSVIGLVAVWAGRRLTAAEADDPADRATRPSAGEPGAAVLTGD